MRGAAPLHKEGLSASSTVRPARTLTMKTADSDSDQRTDVEGLADGVLEVEPAAPQRVAGGLVHAAGGAQSDAQSETGSTFHQNQSPGPRRWGALSQTGARGKSDMRPCERLEEGGGGWSALLDGCRRWAGRTHICDDRTGRHKYACAPPTARRKKPWCLTLAPAPVLKQTSCCAGHTWCLTLAPAVPLTPPRPPPGGKGGAASLTPLEAAPQARTAPHGALSSGFSHRRGPRGPRGLRRMRGQLGQSAPDDLGLSHRRGPRHLIDDSDGDSDR